MSQSLSIGLIAYGLDERRVFVRVPNERGRWVFVDRCVVEVDCPHCRAVAGEPCRARESNQLRGEFSPNPVRYHVGVHVCRKKAWSDKAGFRFPNRHTPPHKPRITAEDMAGAASNLPEGDDR